MQLARPVKSEEQNDARVERNELLLIFSFWTFIAMLSSVRGVLDPRGFGFRFGSPAAPIFVEFMEAWIWAAATPLVFWLTARLAAERSGWLLRVVVLLGAGLVLSIAIDLTVALLRFQILPGPPRRVFSPLRGIARFAFLNQLLVYLAVLVAAFGRNYYMQYHRRLRESAELRAQLADARLDALRMQINPHFLFNTLHAISALVERDPSGVRKMITRLSELLRHTIESRGANEVPLREELDFLRRYIEIMEIRFQGRLEVTNSIDESVMNALVPNLILQPIVENALEHGVNRATGEGKVEITARRDGDLLLLSVRDNGPGLPTDETKGVGVSNTEARLVQIYGDAASLTMNHAAGGGVIAQITIPFHTAGDLKTHGI